MHQVLFCLSRVFVPNLFLTLPLLLNQSFSSNFQKSLHVLEHLLKSDIPCVASRMSQHCTNLQEIAKTESGNVLSKAKKVSLKILTFIIRDTSDTVSFSMVL